MKSGTFVWVLCSVRHPPFTNSLAPERVFALPRGGGGVGSVGGGGDVCGEGTRIETMPLTIRQIQCSSCDNLRERFSDPFVACALH